MPDLYVYDRGSAIAYRADMVEYTELPDELDYYINFIIFDKDPIRLISLSTRLFKISPLEYDFLRLTREQPHEIEQYIETYGLTVRWMAYKLFNLESMPQLVIGIDSSYASIMRDDGIREITRFAFNDRFVHFIVFDKEKVPATLFRSEVYEISYYEYRFLRGARNIKYGNAPKKLLKKFGLMKKWVAYKMFYLELTYGRKR